MPLRRHPRIYCLSSYVVIDVVHIGIRSVLTRNNHDMKYFFSDYIFVDVALRCLQRIECKNNNHLPVKCQLLAQVELSSVCKVDFWSINSQNSKSIRQFPYRSFLIRYLVYHIIVSIYYRSWWSELRASQSCRYSISMNIDNFFDGTQALISYCSLNNFCLGWTRHQVS